MIAIDPHDVVELRDRPVSVRIVELVQVDRMLRTEAAEVFPEYLALKEVRVDRVDVLDGNRVGILHDWRRFVAHEHAAEAGQLLCFLRCSVGRVGRVGRVSAASLITESSLCVISLALGVHLAQNLI